MPPVMKGIVHMVDWAKLCEDSLRSAAVAFCAVVVGTVAKEVFPQSQEPPILRIRPEPPEATPIKSTFK